MTDVELAWLAGLIEGEGAIFTSTQTRRAGGAYRYPRIVVGMTDRDVVARVAALFGTGLHEQKRTYGVSRKVAYRAVIGGAPAAALLRQLRPLMGERRRAKIDEVLAEYDARVPTAVRRREACSSAAAGRPRRVDGTFAGDL